MIITVTLIQKRFTIRSKINVKEYFPVRKIICTISLDPCSFKTIYKTVKMNKVYEYVENVKNFAEY